MGLLIGARVSKMAVRRIWVAASPEYPTRLSSHNTCEGDAGHLATLTLSLYSNKMTSRDSQFGAG